MSDSNYDSVTDNILSGWVLRFEKTSGNYKPGIYT